MICFFCFLVLIFIQSLRAFRRPLYYIQYVFSFVGVIVFFMYSIHTHKRTHRYFHSCCWFSCRCFDVVLGFVVVGVVHTQAPIHIHEHHSIVPILIVPRAYGYFLFEFCCYYPFFYNRYSCGSPLFWSHTQTHKHTNARTHTHTHTVECLERPHKHYYFCTSLQFRLFHFWISNSCNMVKNRFWAHNYHSEWVSMLNQLHVLVVVVVVII